MATLTPATKTLHISTVQAMLASFSPAKVYLIGGGSSDWTSGANFNFTAPGSNATTKVRAENEFWWLALIGGYTSTSNNSATVTAGQRAVSLAAIIDIGSKIKFVIPSGWTSHSGGIIGVREVGSGNVWRITQDTPGTVGLCAYNGGSTEHTFTIADGDVFEFQIVASNKIEISQNGGSPFQFATAYGGSAGLSADITFNASGTYPRPDFSGNWLQTGGNAWLAAESLITTTTDLVIEPITIPNPVETQSYIQPDRFVAIGGVGPITYSHTAGTIPTGMSFNTSTGKFEGTPGSGTAGTYSQTIHATDGTTTGDLTFDLIVETLPVPILFDIGTGGDTFTENVTVAIGSLGAVSSRDAEPDSTVFSDTYMQTGAFTILSSGAMLLPFAGFHPNRDVEILLGFFCNSFSVLDYDIFKVNDDLSETKIAHVFYELAQNVQCVRFFVKSNSDGSAPIKALASGIISGAPYSLVNAAWVWEHPQPTSAEVIQHIIYGDSRVSGFPERRGGWVEVSTIARGCNYWNFQARKFFDSGNTIGIYNLGKDADTLQGMIDNFEERVLPIVNPDASAWNLEISAGTNDLAAHTGAEIFALMLELAALGQAHGARIVIDTLAPRTDTSAYNTKISDTNALVLDSGNQATYDYQVFDVAGISNWGTEEAAMLAGDGLHNSAHGNDVEGAAHNTFLTASGLLDIPVTPPVGGFSIAGLTSGNIPAGSVISIVDESTGDDRTYVYKMINNDYVEPGHTIGTSAMPNPNSSIRSGLNKIRQFVSNSGGDAEPVEHSFNAIDNDIPFTEWDIVMGKVRITFTVDGPDILITGKVKSISGGGESVFSNTDSDTTG